MEPSGVRVISVISLKGVPLGKKRGGEERVRGR
jgi:hypothetical protein